MRIRRMLATLLCLAMIMTSGAFTTVVGAQEANGQADDLTVSVEQEEPAVSGSEQAAETVAEDPNAGAGQDAGEGNAEQPANDETVIGETPVQEEPEVPEAVEEPVEEEPEETEEVEETEEAELVEEPEEAEETTEDEELLGIPSQVTEGFNADPLEWTLEKNMPETILLPPGVTEIPAGVFNLSDYEDSEKNQFARNVKNIYFSDGELATIAAGAFKNSNVAMIAFEEDSDDTPLVIEQNAFDGCANLKQIDLDGIATINQNAFRGCATLSSVNLSSATTIEDGAFQNCSCLGNVVWSTELTKIGENAFSGCALTTLRIAELVQLQTIEDTAFAGNTKLTEINLPDSLTSISFGTFKNCEGLANVTFTGVNNPLNNLSSIEAEAFSGCIALQKIELPCTIRSIGSKAFYGCEAKLLNIYFYTADGVIEFDENAFPGRSDTRGTMFGFEGQDATVKDYAASRGYKFKSLATQYTIKSISNAAGSITSSVKEAPVGAEVTLTVVPRKGYSFTNIKLKYAKDGSDYYVYPELIKSSSQKQIYKFTMPEGNVTIDASYDTAANILKGKLGWKFVPATVGEPDSNLLVFPSAGSSATIVVDVAGTEIGLWNFDLSSSDKEVATISQFGVITGLKKGTANISLVSPTEKNKKIVITVQVGENAEIDTLLFDRYFETTEIKDATIIAPDPTRSDPYANPLYYVVEYNMNKTATTDHTFEPHVCAYFLDGEDAPDPLEPPQPGDPKELYVGTTWTSKNTNLVTVENAKSSLNENLITVKKGTFGETFVDVRYINDDGTIVKTGFVIRIVNSTPRMNDEKIQVNAHLQAGTDLNYENVYNYDFYKEGGLEVHTTRVVNGVPLYNYIPAFHATYQCDEEGNVCGISLSANAKLLNLKEGGKKTYSSAAMLYVEGKQFRKRLVVDDHGDPILDDDDNLQYEPDMNTLTTFHMPIKETEVINLMPKVSLSYSGKLNLLYNIDADADINEKNYVSVLHNVKNIPNPKIEAVEFMSEANYKFKQGKGMKEEPDKFAHNYFPAGSMYDNKLNEIGFKVIVNPAILVDSDFEKDGSGKIVSNGYASITFKGYNEPIIVPITIPYTYKFPNYALSVARVVADSRRNNNPAYKVQIVDADTYPRKQVDLYEDDGTTSKIPDDGLYQDVTASTPPGYFNEPIQMEREPVLDENDEPVLDKDGNPLYKDYIKISADGYARNGKERILLRMAGWRKPMSFDFTMVTTTAMATAKCAPSTAIVNLNTPSQKKEIRVIYNLAGTMKAADSDFEYVGPAGKDGEAKDAAESIILDWGGTGEEPVIEVTLPNDFERPGSYAFKTAPIAKYGDEGNEFVMKDIRFTVRVIETRPVLSLKPATFTLNTHYPNKGEIAEAETSIKNMPGDYDLNIDNIHLVAITPNLPIDWRGDIIERNENNKIVYDDDGNVSFSQNGDWRNSLQFSIIEDEKGNLTKLGVKLLKIDHPDAFNYAYDLYGLKYGEEEIENSKPIRIKISCHDRYETLTLSPEGSLNQIIPDSKDPDPEIKEDVPGFQIIYKETMKNLNGTVDKVKMVEVDPDTRQYYKNDDEEFYSPHFKAVADPEKKTISLTLVRNNIMGTDSIPPLKSGKNYQLFLYYHIPEKGTAADTYEKVPIKLNVTPKQALPKLKQDTDNCKMYIGGNAEKRMFTVCVGKLNCHNAVFNDAVQPEEDPVDPDTYVFDPHDTIGNQSVIKIADTASEGIRRTFYVKSVKQWEDPLAENPEPLYMKTINGSYVLDPNKHKIPCAYITVALDQPAMLKDGATYTIPIEIRYKDQADNIRGTIINYKVKILK